MSVLSPPLSRRVRRVAATVAAVGLVAVVPAVAVTAAPAAGAPARAGVTVTIRADGTDLSGVVRSSKVSCKNNRTVVVYRQVGRRGGGDDRRFASDTSGLQGGRYTWSTGNTGTEGRFYARIARKPGCKAAASRTVRAARSD